MINFTKDELRFLVRILDEGHKDLVFRQKQRLKKIEEARNNPDKSAFFKKASKNVPLVDADIRQYEDILAKLKKQIERSNAPAKAKRKSGLGPEKGFMILIFDKCHGYYIQDHEGHTLTHGYDVETTLIHLNRFRPKYVIEKGFVHGEHFAIIDGEWRLVDSN